MRKPFFALLAVILLPAAAIAQAAEGDINSKDSLGRTPLSFALATGQSPEVIQMLLKEGAAPAKLKAGEASAPLDGEPTNGDRGVLPAPSLDISNLNEPKLAGPSLDSASLDATDRMGRTPLGYAIATGQSPWVLQALIQAGADPSARSLF
jgi:ankyrin repeat protein